MSRSVEGEDELFEQARRAFEAGDLAAAGELFRQVVELNGSRRYEAQRYLVEINHRRSQVLLNLGSGRDAGTKRWSLPAAPPAPKLPAPVSLPGDFSPLPPDSDPGGFPMEISGESPAAPEILQRTPHMDLDPPPPAAGVERIKVSVYADTGALREGEEGETVAVPLPLGQDHVDVNVWLVVEEPFAVEGEDTRRLTLRRDQARSETLEFTVVRKGLSTSASVLFSALFAYKGRPCGRVSRAVALAAGADPVQVPLPDPAVQVETGAKAADLQVRIVRSGTDEQTFECHVQTPLLAAYADGVAGPWRLSSLARDLVREQMSHFTTKGATVFARTAALLGAGYNLFEATPPLFQKVFWELLDAGQPLRSISIVTEEPYIPWELLVPNRTLVNGETEEREQPLGVDFAVSRWTSRNHLAAPQKITLRDAYVIAPKESRLPEAEEEAALVMAQFAGQRVDPASPEVLDRTLDQGGRALLHFICHGVSGEAGSQTLQMDQNQKLFADSLRGMRGVKKACKASKPVIFLNACEVGREEPALVGTGGFAETFMSLGASAVIAPLWSVKDTIAHEIAVTFYQRIKAEPATPLAEILRDLRAKSYVPGGGEDSYAAYCFYGDPLATAG